MPRTPTNKGLIEKPILLLDTQEVGSSSLPDPTITFQPRPPKTKDLRAQGRPLPGGQGVSDPLPMGAKTDNSDCILPAGAGVRPYYSHAGIVIYHGDCREILPTLPKVDAVITDPVWPNCQATFPNIVNPEELLEEALLCVDTANGRAPFPSMVVIFRGEG